MNILNYSPYMGVVVGIAFYNSRGNWFGMTELTVAQTPMDNTTNANMMAQDNMTSSAGNMTVANMKQIGNMPGCGNECF